MDFRNENRRSRRSSKRRSSILKMTGVSYPLSDLDPNQPLDSNVPGKKSRLSSVRRVSFADTFQIKEFQKDSPRQWLDEEQNNDESGTMVQDDSPSADENNQRQNTGEISGLDMLLTGTIQNSEDNLIEKSVKELPLPDDQSVNVPCDSHNHTIYDNLGMDMTGSYGNIYDPGNDGFGDEEVEIKIDPKAFLSNLTSGSGKTKNRPTENEGDLGSTSGSPCDPYDNVTLHDNVQMELTGCYGNNQESAKNNPCEEETTVMVDGKAFLQSLSKNIKLPSESLSEMNIFVPQKQFSPEKKVLGFYSIDSETDVQTINNTSINKYTNYGAAVHNITDVSAVESLSDTTVKTKRKSPSRTPLICISDKLANNKNQAEEGSQSGSRTSEGYLASTKNHTQDMMCSSEAMDPKKNVNLDPRLPNSHVVADRQAYSTCSDVTVIFHQDNDMECTDVVSNVINTEFTSKKVDSNPGPLSRGKCGSPDKTVVFDQCDMEQTEVILSDKLFSYDVQGTINRGSGEDNKTIYFGGFNDMEETGLITNNILMGGGAREIDIGRTSATDSCPQQPLKARQTSHETPVLSMVVSSVSVMENKTENRECFPGLSSTKTRTHISYQLCSEKVTSEKIGLLPTQDVGHNPKIVTGSSDLTYNSKYKVTAEQDNECMGTRTDTITEVNNTTLVTEGNSEVTQGNSGTEVIFREDEVQCIVNDLNRSQHKMTDMEKLEENKTVYFESNGAMEETEVMTKVTTEGTGVSESRREEGVGDAKSTLSSQYDKTVYFLSEGTMEETQGLTGKIVVSDRSTQGRNEDQKGMMVTDQHTVDEENKTSVGDGVHRNISPAVVKLSDSEGTARRQSNMTTGNCNTSNFVNDTEKYEGSVLIHNVDNDSTAPSVSLSSGLAVKSRNSLNLASNSKQEKPKDIRSKSLLIPSRGIDLTGKLNFRNSGVKIRDGLPPLGRRSLVKLSSDTRDLLADKEASVIKVNPNTQARENLKRKWDCQQENDQEIEINDGKVTKTEESERIDVQTTQEGSTSCREGITDQMIPIDLLNNTTVDGSMIQTESTNTLLQMNTDSMNTLLGLQPITTLPGEGLDSTLRQNVASNRSTVAELSTCQNTTTGDPSYTQSIREQMEGSILSQSSISKLMLSVAEENMDEVPEGPLTVEAFCKFIQMMQPYWLTGLILTECRGSVALKSIQSMSHIFLLLRRLSKKENIEEVDSSDLKSVLEAQVVQKSHVESHKTVFEEAFRKSESVKKIVADLDENYLKNQPQIFQYALSCTPEQRSQLSDKVTLLGNVCTKLGKCASKKIGAEAVKSNIEILKTKMNDLCTQTEDLFQYKSSTEECLTAVNKVLEELDSHIVELEQVQYPTYTEISEWKCLQDNIYQKALVQTTYEEGESDSKRKRNEISNQNKRLEEELLNLQSNPSVNKEKADLIAENEADLRERINTIECVSEWILDEEMTDDRAQYFWFYEESALLEVRKGPSGDIGSLQFLSMLKDGAPDSLRMAHNLLLSLIDCASLTSKYTKSADLPQVLQEISVVVCEVRSLFQDIDQTSQHFLLSYGKSSVLVEIWSLKFLRKVNITFTFPCCPQSTTFRIEPSVSVVMGKFSGEDILQQMNQVKNGPGFVRRLCEAVDLGAVKDK